MSRRRWRERTISPAPDIRRARLLILLALLPVFAATLSLCQIWQDVPPAAWWQALSAPDPDHPGQMLVAYVTLPRIVASLLAGASLGLSGVIFQQLLRNPLVEASTLGLSGGAGLALKLSILLVPTLALPPLAVAALGATVAMGLTMLLAARDAMSPTRLILAGLVVGLFCDMASSVMALFFHEQLRSVFLWNAGSLLNLGWDASGPMALALLGCAIGTAMLARPLELLDLGDGGARGLGLPIGAVRLAGVTLAVVLACATIASVGVIGFIGIAAPTLARLAGVRTLRARLVAAPLLGAALVWLADQLTQINPLVRDELPTGVVTAVLVGPLLLWMLPRLRTARPGPEGRLAAVTARTAPPRIAFPAWMLLLAIVLCVALMLGRHLDGWFWQTPFGPAAVLEWRWPRVVAAALAGALLAAAGLMIQRLSGNAMAGPEVLGISSGAALGAALLFLIDPAAGQGLKLAAASGGAFIVLAATFASIRRSTASPERMLLAGVALATLFGAFLAAVTARSDPRIASLLAWLAGSTYAVTATDAQILAAVALVLAAVTPLTRRWLDILPLGAATARAVGVDVHRSRILLLLLASLLTGAAVLAIGPLSFVGLMAPHLARMIGWRSASAQLAMSAIFGALIMTLADWGGRNLLFPYQVPAGMLAALGGTPYFIALLWKRPT